MVAHESVSLAVCCIGVCSALQGPPNALQLADYISITWDPVIPIPGGPGPLNQNLEWVRGGVEGYCSNSRIGSH